MRGNSWAIGSDDGTHIGAEGDLNPGAQRLLEGNTVDRDALAVTYAARRVRRVRIVVVDGERRHQPGALFHHLGDLRVRELEAVLYRVASAIESALQADTVVGVTGDFLPPAVCLIDDRLELFDRQSGLRNERALLIDP